MYQLPYHWFPQQRLYRFQREEKQRIIYSLIDQHGPASIDQYLDVGCGDGRWTADITDHLRTAASGVDISERAIGFARLIRPDIHFEIVSGHELPHADAAFDLITAIEVIEHLDDDLEEQVIGEIRRVLKPGGLFLMTVPSVRLRLIPRHYRHYSVASLRELLAGNGFEVLDIRGQSIPYAGWQNTVRKYANRVPFIWMLWRSTYREISPDKALNLIALARPAPTP
jgi:SAM-dependent methyltransferase